MTVRKSKFPHFPQLRSRESFIPIQVILTQAQTRQARMYTIPRWGPQFNRSQLRGKTSHWVIAVGPNIIWFSVMFIVDSPRWQLRRVKGLLGNTFPGRAVLCARKFIRVIKVLSLKEIEEPVTKASKYMWGGIKCKTKEKRGSKF